MVIINSKLISKICSASITLGRNNLKDILINNLFTHVTVLCLENTAIYIL